MKLKKPIAGRTFDKTAAINPHNPSPASRGFLLERSMEQYYLQDSRSFVGNDMLFWAKDGKGYTTDVSKAHVYSLAEATAQHRGRSSDIPWPKEYIDGKTRPAVDFQYADIEAALQGSGIILLKPEKQNRAVLRCHQCSSFISEYRFWASECTRCGLENRP